METNTYTKEIGNVTYIISSIPCSAESEKVLKEKLKKLILNESKNKQKGSSISGKWVAILGIKSDVYTLTNGGVFMSENKQKLIELCKAKGAKIQGTEHLIEYYQKALGWSEPQAVEYAIKLFEDGTIDSIMVISKEGGNDDDTNW